MKKLVLYCLSITCAVLATSRVAHAQIVAFITSPSNVVVAQSTTTYGYSFSLANSVRVTQLGFFDYQGGGQNSGPGLGQATPVTIWNNAGVQQVRATVPAGVGVTVDGYIYVALATPVTLAAGTYTIAAYTNGLDNVQQGVATLTPAAGITYNGSRIGSGDAFPTTVSNANSYFGPNFQIVPEPGTWMLLALGSAGAILARRARHNR